jgi:hypothetical protein
MTPRQSLEPKQLCAAAKQGGSAYGGKARKKTGRRLKTEAGLLFLDFAI